MVVKINDGRHTWIGDEPVDAKGTDMGPNPYELLLSSLAACTCITMRLYADHKGIKLDAISAEYSHDKVDVSEIPGREGTGKVDRIRSKINIVGDFDEAQRKRLTDIAGRCPVHKTLANGVFLVDAVSFDAK